MDRRNTLVLTKSPELVPHSAICQPQSAFPIGERLRKKWVLQCQRFIGQSVRKEVDRACTALSTVACLHVHKVSLRKPLFLPLREKTVEPENSMLREPYHK
jgi:hypothetical protein